MQEILKGDAHKQDQWDMFGASIATRLRDLASKDIRRANHLKRMLDREVDDETEKDNYADGDCD